MPSWADLLALVGAITGSAAFINAIVSVKNARSSKRQLDGDYIESMAAAASSLITPLSTRVHALEQELREEKRSRDEAENRMGARIFSLQRQINALHSGISLLTDQIIKLGETPVWIAPKENPHE